MRTLTKVLAGLAVVVALVVGVAWWEYPMHKIERELRAFDVPDGVELVHEDSQDNGWICFDSCSWGDRYYVSTLPAATLAEAVEQAMRERGYDEVAASDCAYHEVSTPDWFQVSDCTHYIRGGRRGVGTSVYIGKRADGRIGMEIGVMTSG